MKNWFVIRNRVITIYNDVIDSITGTPHNELVKIIFSVPKINAPRAVIKPVLLKSVRAWQCEKIIEKSAFHENIPESGLREYLNRLLDENQYRQINIITVRDVITYRVSKKLKLSMTKAVNKTSAKPVLDHDNIKNYLLTEGMPVLPLVDLGVLTKDFRIIKAKYNKFKQINNFLKNIDTGLGKDIGENINIIEFGCGKSYLTFIIYYFFKYLKKINVNIIGYDKNPGVVNFCNEVALKYKYENLKFIEGDISEISLYKGNVDMIMTLHACDTATDHALYYAIKNKVKHIFCVPCCQQEVNAQIKCGDEYALLLRYGLYKERFSALLTDCIRCDVLNDSGYFVDVVEFVGEENTPKNAMIRARYTGYRKNYVEAIRKLATQLGIEQTLLKLMENEDTLETNI